MVTVRLNIQENALDRVMQSLKVFTFDEVVIVTEDQNFLADHNYLHKEIEEINNGNAELISLEDLEKSISEVIEKHENLI